MGKTGDSLLMELRDTDLASGYLEDYTVIGYDGFYVTIQNQRDEGIVLGFDDNHDVGDVANCYRRLGYIVDLIFWGDDSQYFGFERLRSVAS